MTLLEQHLAEEHLQQDWVNADPGLHGVPKHISAARKVGMKAHTLALTHIADIIKPG